MKNLNCQSGNVLFLILIAVALFAALSYAVTQSSRSGTSPGGEQGQIAAAELIQYGTYIESAVRNVRLIGRCTEQEISFFRTGVTALAAYEHTSESTNCQVFDPSGGKAPFVEPNTTWLDEAKNAQAGYQNIYYTWANAVDGVGTDADDLIMVVPHLKFYVCRAINRRLINSIDIPDNTGGILLTEYAGTTSGAGTVAVTGETAVRAMCVNSSGTGDIPADSYTYYQVLVEG